MFDTDWTRFVWNCGKCGKTALRVLNILTQLNGKLVFSTECRNCEEKEAYGYLPEVLTLLHRRPDTRERFVEPPSTREDRIIVSLEPLIPCCFCGGKSEVLEVSFSNFGLLLETACSNGSHPNSVRELSFECILAFCADRRLYLPIELEWLSHDEVARFAEERPDYGPS